MSTMRAIAKHQLIILSIIAIFAVTACSPAVTSNPVPVAATAGAGAVSPTLPPEAESQTSQPGATIPINAPEAVAADDLQAAIIGVYQQANLAVVYIIVPSVGSGSGFVYSQDGYIVTNRHVVAGGRNFEVVFANGERQRAELVGSDTDSDLAVLKVDRLPDGVGPLALGDSNSIQVGQFVVAIGNPFGEQGSISFGIVSGVGRSLPSQRETTSGSTYALPEVIQTDAPINPGNSGGPLLNLAGEVLGVNAAIATTTGTNSGVGFSIPVSAIKLIVPSLIGDGEYVYPYMGAGFDGDITLDDQSDYGLSQTQGAYVINVTSGSPADNAGLIPANGNTGRGGDLVVAIDGRSIVDFADLNSYLVFQTAVGQTIEITVLRDGERVVLPLTLGARP
ncbi:MAG TPA: trypsin-like peptidase domain-containing protein [Anaerolineae bacterium]|nr:trypsin-like peptidase domain-containing protein [Anaerolineae bacterium]